MQRFLRVSMICLMVVFVSALAANAATFVVNTTNDTVDATPGDGTCADGSAQCSLRAAIGEANALAGDDTITIPAGTYTQSLVAANEDLNAGGDWDITSNITINGAGAATTILQAAATPGTATERVMEITSTTAVVTIAGVTLRHGNKTGAAAATTRGGGIRSQGTLTINDSIVTLNNSSGGGGIRNERTITLNNVTVSNNACNNGGATCFGGGMYNNLAALTTVTINNSTFSGNSSVSPGTNGFGFAAGLGIEGTLGFNIVISGSAFTGNIGTGTGTGGSNGNGIRILPTAAGTANITNSVFSNNSGTGGASIQGVGITAFTSGAGTLTGTWDRVSITGNTGTTAPGLVINPTGGAANLTITNSTISGNVGSASVGGVLASNAGATSGAASVINFVNSTISGNSTAGAGGGVLLEQPAATGSMTMNFNFCTIANNGANTDNTGTDSGGGIFRSTAGALNLKNTIVGDNFVGTGGLGPDIFGAINSQDYNHIENTAGATIGGTTTNNTTGDAILGALANNGGSTQTHLPGAGSAALNAIPNATNDCGTVVTTDQRGVTRPDSGACEKGSVEVSSVIVKSRADFDGDGRTDVSVFRPSEGNWYLNRSTAGLVVSQFGLSTDTLVPGDYDGDQKADLAIFRPDANPANPDFYVLNSNGNILTGASWGIPGDTPISGDYDGDGKNDRAVFRSSNAVWYVILSGGGSIVEPFGLTTDIPLAIDNDGDGKTNLAVYRPGTNTWYIARPTGVPAQNFDASPYGLAGDLLVPADYDGDNKDDIAVFRPSAGTWFIRRSTNGNTDIVTFGTSGDVPVPGDYDGDGKDDVAVYRNGQWWLNRSTSGLAITNFGNATDTPIPKRYIP
ncbi:MAG: VCBS repeat-containing protein [Acidobacteria bacterium]|nr:VCBS repeat-containing protein [Acidobacteriota bacterium]